MLFSFEVALKKTHVLLIFWILEGKECIQEWGTSSMRQREVRGRVLGTRSVRL